MNITGFGKALQIKGPTLYRWYKDVLSDYARDKTMMHKNDITHPEKGKEIGVPILKPENVGAKMCLDEKHIGDEIYTIMSNRQTGKIAMICKSINYSEIKQVFEKLQPALNQIQSITRDFSPLFEKVCSVLIPQTMQVGDKFHVIKNLMEAHQSVRIRYRQKELEKRRKALQEFKALELARLKECERTGKTFKPDKFHYQEEKLENGETLLEILARSRYLLYKFRYQWTERQQKRALALFRKYPEIEKTYSLCNDFRILMGNKNIGQHYLHIDKQLHQWYEDVELSEIDELQNFKALVESNEQIIRNYFISGETNSIAEAINSKIQRLIASNYGTRDPDFFFFRLSQFYA
ncbi:MAG: transposase [Bacteroidetes bacterium]|nr:transposase [Bacteroidota bacterium]